MSTDISFCMKYINSQLFAKKTITELCIEIKQLSLKISRRF